MESSIAVGGTDTAKPLNLRKRVEIVSRAVRLPGARVLDAGCGAGEYVLAMAELGAEAEGIEYVEAKVAEWQASHPGDPRVRRGDLAGLDFPDARFDAVLLNEVLEHVPDDHRALDELFRVLKPGGTLILFSPNRYHPFETHGVLSKKTGRNSGFLRTFLLPWVPVAIGARFVDYWSRNYWPLELRRMVERHGFETASHSYVWQTFENISGDRPGWVARIVPVARWISATAERLPFFRRFGVSQLIVARRPARAS
ncbi:class I SAM-dependent methyltransferase [Sphingomonas sp.]|uniref:class I SAM-dependent methyltransferase n=1 Tax=Sphingomonas sp. TaxID=28214 RepID=UPI003AFF797B